MVTVDTAAVSKQLSLLNNGKRTTLAFVMLSIYAYLTKRDIPKKEWLPNVQYAITRFVNEDEIDMKTMGYTNLVTATIEDNVNTRTRLNAFEDLLLNLHYAIINGKTVTEMLEEKKLFPDTGGEAGLLFRQLIFSEMEKLCEEVKPAYQDCIGAVCVEEVPLTYDWVSKYINRAKTFLSSHPSNDDVDASLSEYIAEKKSIFAKYGVTTPPPPPPPPAPQPQPPPVVVKVEPAPVQAARQQNYEEATKRMDAAADAFHREMVDTGPVARFWYAVRDLFTVKPAETAAPSIVNFDRPAAPLPAYKQVFLDRPAAPLPQQPVPLESGPSAYVQLDSAPGLVNWDGKPAVVASQTPLEIARRRAEAHWAKHPRARARDMAKLSRRIATDPYAYNPAKEDWIGVDTP